MFWLSGVRSRAEGLRLGRRELVVCQRARGVQLCEVFDLVGRVRRRRRMRRVLRLLLAGVGGGGSSSACWSAYLASRW